MSIEIAEKLKSQLTDKYVVVKQGVPELRRFASLTGRRENGQYERTGPGRIQWAGRYRLVRYRSGISRIVEAPAKRRRRKNMPLRRKRRRQPNPQPRRRNRRKPGQPSRPGRVRSRWPAPKGPAVLRHRPPNQPRLRPQAAVHQRQRSSHRWNWPGNREPGSPPGSPHLRNPPPHLRNPSPQRSRPRSRPQPRQRRSPQLPLHLRRPSHRRPLEKSSRRWNWLACRTPARPRRCRRRLRPRSRRRPRRQKHWRLLSKRRLPLLPQHPRRRRQNRQQPLPPAFPERSCRRWSSPASKVRSKATTANRQPESMFLIRKARSPSTARPSCQSPRDTLILGKDTLRAPKVI